MSVRAAIVKPHPSLLSLFHLPRKEKLCNSDSWGAVTEIALCPVNTVCRHIGRGKKKQNLFFFSWWETKSDVTRLTCLSLLLFSNTAQSLPPFVTGYLSQTKQWRHRQPWPSDPREGPPQGRSSPHHSLTMIGSCFQSQMELRLCCVLNLLIDFHISVKFSKGEQKMPVKQSAAWHTV